MLVSLCRSSIPFERKTGHSPVASREIFSQMGYVIMIVEKKVLGGEQGKACIVDWKSHTCKRVVRSTFSRAKIPARGKLSEWLKQAEESRHFSARAQTHGSSERTRVTSSCSER